MFGADWNIGPRCVVLEGMTSYGDWLKPTLLGPLFTMWGLTTLGSVLVGMHALSGGRFDSWLLGMLLVSFFGAALGVLLVGVDVMLLRSKLRALPTGGRAWISSVLTPLGVLFIWSLPFFGPPESAVGQILFIVGPMTAACFGTRLLFGRRP
jgi:hypothetical protein